MGFLTFDAVAFIILLGVGYAYVFRRRTPLPLPPGPKQLPIVGNLFDIPKDHAWKQYKQWAEEYGDVISLSALGQVIVVLNSHESVKKVLQSAPATVFASRPLVKFAELTRVQTTNVSLQIYGKDWRDRRRIMDNYFRPASLENYRAVQNEKLAYALKRIVADPANYLSYIRHYTGSVILSITYGYDAKEKGDPFVDMAVEVNRIATRTLLPGAMAVNTFPILGKLPPWLLGQKFVEMLRHATWVNDRMLHAPFEWVKTEMKKGTARQSLVRDALEELKEGDSYGELVQLEAFGLIFGAGADTSVAGLATFILVMLLYPDVQAKARHEIDAVVGRDRLPTFADRPNLPYMTAVLMEVLRWALVLPQGLPHATTEDVIIGNYCIPKGATVIGNAWSILHDPKSYPDPETFNPERYLSLDGKVINDPMLDYAFGYGIRKCPGRHLAEATMWLAMSSIVAAFEIMKTPGAADISASSMYPPNGLMIHPHPFDCTLKPRDAQALQAIESL